MLIENNSPGRKGSRVSTRAVAKTKKHRELTIRRELHVYVHTCIYGSSVRSCALGQTNERRSTMAAKRGSLERGTRADRVAQ
ncbi:hypothetical protein WH47_04172 [Habropoda laboriosa]|uniref:Uncharacterized protein n=1 Tax=Habropoda laboriosa TaxID=597456 RepID=A0A0L7QV28_9HYME|nr:hypothetical protein WH47_04172 [Habropoda laboriosa]